MLLWLTSTSPATADLFVVFQQGHAHSGQRVNVFSGDRDGHLESWPSVQGVRMYFVAMSHAKSPARQLPTGPPRNSAWIPLGPLRHSSAGVFRFRFRVPHVKPGSYTIGYWCIPCAPPQGATFTQAYPGQRATGKRFDTMLVIKPTTDVAVAPDSDRLARAVLIVLVLGAIAAAGYGAKLLMRRRGV